LLHGEKRAVTAVFWNLENDCDVGPVKWETFLDSLRDGVFVCSLIVCESPDL